MKKYRVLVVYDVDYDTPSGKEGWCYYFRSHALQKLQPEDMQIDICSQREFNDVNLKTYQLVFALDYMCAPAMRSRVVGAGAQMLVSHNKDHRSREKEWPQSLRCADFLITNNMARFLHDGGPQPRTACISNGIDTDYFYQTTPISERPHKVIWTGGTGKKKLKMHSECIQKLEKPLEEMGFEHSFRPITEINGGQCYTRNQMREWYNGASYVICASGSEGSPGSCNESMACGCVFISTPVGHVPELVVDKENGLIVPTPDPALFIEAIKYASEHRERLSAAALESIKGWSYGPPGDRAQYFMQLFRRLIDDGPNSVEPFSYRDKHWSEI